MLNEILKETFGYVASGQSNDVAITSMPEFDSMNHMIFISKMETQYGVEFTGDEIMRMLTINSIKEVLKSKGVAEI